MGNFTNKPLPPLDHGWLATQCLIGSFMFTMGFLDLSVASASTSTGQLEMLAWHASWKSSPPYLRVIMTVLALCIPLALFQLFTEDVLGVMYRGRETAKRCALGAITILLLPSAITIVATKIAPREAQLATFVVGEDRLSSEAAAEIGGELWRWYLILTLINVTLLILPFMKYDAANSKPKAKASAAPTGKKKKTDTKKQK